MHSILIIAIGTLEELQLLFLPYALFYQSLIASTEDENEKVLIASTTADSILDKSIYV